MWRWLPISISAVAQFRVNFTAFPSKFPIRSWNSNHPHSALFCPIAERFAYRLRLNETLLHGDPRSTSSPQSIEVQRRMGKLFGATAAARQRAALGRVG